MANAQSGKKSNDEKVFDGRFYIIALLFGIASLLFSSLPWLFSKQAFFDSLVFNSDTGTIGDTIGGTMGPFVAILAAFLTFLAFWMQYKANKAQTKQFEDQAKDVAIDRFEGKFFELVKIHRENVESAAIQGTHLHGDAFEALFSELQLLYELVSAILRTRKEEKDFSEFLNNQYAVLDLSYLLFYFGLEGNKTHIFSDTLFKNYPKHVISFVLTKIMDDTSDGRYKYQLSIPVSNNLSSNYRILEGHHTFLGKYYRHLFGTVKFISRQPKELIDESEKCSYASTLRSQLSDFEQLLLYFNSLTSLGNEWNSERNNFISRFRMIKNIPIPLANFGPIPKVVYREDIISWKNKGKSFFEWDNR